MKILVIGSGSYVIGRNKNDYGTILPAIVKFYREINKDIELYVYSKSKNNLNNFEKKIKYFNFEISKFTFFSKEDVSFSKLINQNIFDLAIICVPDHLHFYYLKQILMKKIHTLVVKPFVLKLSQAKILTALEKKYDLICRVEHHKRYDPTNLYLKDQIQNKKLGKINHFLVQYSQSKVMPNEIFKSWFKKSNIINYIGIHYLDLAYFLTGYQPKILNSLELKNNENKIIGNILNISWTKTKNKKKDNFTQTLILNLNEPLNTPVPSRQKINLLFERGRVDIEQDYRGISQIIESKNLNYINPQFSKVFNLGKNQSIYGYGIESIFYYIIMINNLKNCSKYFYLDLNPTFNEASKLIHILDELN